LVCPRCAVEDWRDGFRGAGCVSTTSCGENATRVSPETWLSTTGMVCPRWRS